jgi:hypothetical protein
MRKSLSAVICSLALAYVSSHAVQAAPFVAQPSLIEQQVPLIEQVQMRQRPGLGGARPGLRPGGGFRPGRPGGGFRPPIRPNPGFRPPFRPGPGFRPPIVRPPVVRPPVGYYRPWRGRYWRPGIGWAVGSIVAIGALSAAAAAAYAPPPPAPGMCWYYTDASYRVGYWAACQ